MHDFDAKITEIGKGLLAPQPFISPKYFYNKLGSKLFEAICELPEYYLTRTEKWIVSENVKEISCSIGNECNVIDLGAGNCEKAERLFPCLKPNHYVPVDISIDFLLETVDHLRKRHPTVKMTPVEMDFSGDFYLPGVVPREKRLFSYFGSSIGNSSPEDACTFLTQIRKECGIDGSLLIGVDLLKDPSILTAAYNDPLGVTASFNLNILLHLNSLLRADFRTEDWRHRGYFNPHLGRIEMHLEAKRRVLVQWKGGERFFEPEETIHTESCFKYTKESFLQLLRKAGFFEVNTWSDPHSWFLLCHAKAEPWN